MKIDLISHIEEFGNNYLVISGIYGGKTLSILNESLDVVQEFEIPGIELWGADFHISEVQNKVLISIYSTHTTKLSNWKYQGFTTHWYELKRIKDEFSFSKIITWERSDIRRVKSVQIDNSFHWIAFRDLNYQHQKERTGKKTAINHVSNQIELCVPEFNSSVLITKHLDHNFDLLIDNENIYLSTISFGAPDKCGLIKIDKNNETTLIQYFDVPLRKLHHYQSNRIVKIEENIFAYFWTTSHESSKKYQFEIHQTVNLNQSTISKSTSRLVDSDFTYGIIWNKPKTISYRKAYKSNTKYVAELDPQGKIQNEESIENWFPIHIGLENDLICVSEDQKEIKLIKRKSW